MRPQGTLVYKNPFASDLKSRSEVSVQRRNFTPNTRHHVKLSRVTRATRTACQERLACKGTLPVAIYDCVDCRTLQCDVCEALIHENPKLIFHDRKKLQFPSENVICQASCETRNFADVYCNSCDKRLCFACDLIVHKHESVRGHYRVSFELEEFFSLPQRSLQNIESPSWNGEEFLSIIPEEQSPRIENSEFHSDFRQSGHSIGTEDPEIENPSTSLSDYSTMLSMHTMLSTDACSSTENSVSAMSNLSLSNNEPQIKSFLLVNNEEILQVATEDEFVQLLGCKPDTQLKVISIFGNTGAGKSFTLNNTFFNGSEVFETSDKQISCTFGVWAAYNKQLELLVFDTEGLLGITEDQSKRTRLLMKILALSDIIIYRTRAERLQHDFITFLGDASKVYIQHFSKELKATMEKLKLNGPVSLLGPDVIVFQETVTTQVLTVNEDGKKPEEQLMDCFRECRISIEAFSKVVYVGTRTKTGTTSFTGLAIAVKNILDSCSIRSSRKPAVVFQLLKSLNNKYSGEIIADPQSLILLEYFTCNVYCQSCNNRCIHSTNHITEGIPHHVTTYCRYQHQFENKIYLCVKCYNTGKTTQVIPKTSSSDDSPWFGLAKYALYGYVIECPNCGIIYQSRKYWYGNKDPCETSVRTEVCHVWPGQANSSSELNPNIARRVIESVSGTLDAVSNISAKPTKMLTNWMADQFAPSYWKQNHMITQCGKCTKEFTDLDKKHHCRSCGGGFCGDCSSQKRTVPERGWGSTPVRVCDICFAEGRHESPSISEDTPVAARIVGEVLHGAIGKVASGISYPIGFIKDSARPSYWVADEDISNCHVCDVLFSLKIPLHHCRSCGQGVCDSCSKTMKPVPNRGWDYDVRVCDKCVQIADK